jgi:hypothetical protein
MKWLNIIVGTLALLLMFRAFRAFVAMYVAATREDDQTFHLWPFKRYNYDNIWVLFTSIMGVAILVIAANLIEASQSQAFSDWLKAELPFFFGN